MRSRRAAVSFSSSFDGTGHHPRGGFSTSSLALAGGADASGFGALASEACPCFELMLPLVDVLLPLLLEVMTLVGERADDTEAPAGDFLPLPLAGRAAAALADRVVVGENFAVKFTPFAGGAFTEGAAAFAAAAAAAFTVGAAAAFAAAAAAAFTVGAAAAFAAGAAAARVVDARTGNALRAAVTPLATPALEAALMGARDHSPLLGGAPSSFAGTAGAVDTAREEFVPRNEAPGPRDMKRPAALDRPPPQEPALLVCSRDGAEAGAGAARVDFGAIATSPPGLWPSGLRSSAESTTRARAEVDRPCWLDGGVYRMVDPPGLRAVDSPGLRAATVASASAAVDPGRGVALALRRAERRGDVRRAEEERAEVARAELGIAEPAPRSCRHALISSSIVLACAMWAAEDVLPRRPLA